MAFFGRSMAKDPDALTAEGMQHLENGDPISAIASFGAAVEADPEHGQAWYGKGCAHSAMEQHHEAIQAHEQSAKYAGDRVALPLFNMGNAYQELGQMQEAARCFHQAAQADPTMADAWINLGRILDDSGEHQAAVETYDLALEIDPEDSMAWSNRGNSLRSLGRHDEALISYRKALEQDESDFAAVIGSGACLVQCGQPEEGLATLQQAVEDSQHPMAVFEFATALGKVDQHEAAIAMYDMLVENEFVSAEIFNNRGECLSRTDQIDAALDSFDQAIAFDADFAPAYFGKARALVNAERLDEARPLAHRYREIGDKVELATPAVQALFNVCGIDR
jgi:tetratricopeptide (TPR) repeat protein